MVVLKISVHLLPSKGRKKAENVIAWLVPGSWMVDAQIRKEGIDKILTEAGFAIRQPGCSACLAMNDEKILPESIQYPPVTVISKVVRAPVHVLCWPVRW